MPSILTIILIALAGIFFHHGFNYLMALSGRRKNTIHALFGLLCLLGSVYAVSCLFVYRSTDVPSYIIASKTMSFMARVIMLILPWFIGLYTGFMPKRFLIALTALFLLLGVLIWVLPGSYLYPDLQSLKFRETPWGERIASAEGPVSRVVYLLYIAYLSVILYAFEACRRLFVRGDRGRAWMLVSVAAFAAVAFVNDTLLDAGVLRSFYLEEYVLFAFLLIVGAWLGAQRIRAEGNYRTLFHAVNDGIFVHDAGTGKLLDVNDTAVRMFGASREELLHGDISKFCSGIPPFTVSEAVQHIRQAAKEGPRVFEWHACRANEGEFFWVEVALRAAVIDGRSVVLAAVRDISDRKKAETEKRTLEIRMQQTQKLESLGLLAGGVAHDFNNMLTAVLGNTSLAMSELPPSSQAWEPLEGIRTTVDRAADLCHQLLAYSGKGGFRPKPVDLKTVAGDISRILAVTIPRKVRLDMRFDPAMLPIQADPTQVRQVMMNLLTNSAESIGFREGTITLTTALRDMDRDALQAFTGGSEVPEGRYGAMVVEDTGCGMDEATREKVFEPFFTTKFAGRGLGMAAVLGIVRGHKGAIRVESTSGSGTTVTVLFPLANGETLVPAREEAGPGVASPSSGRTILVVDDDLSVLKAVSRLVGAMGYQVLSAESGRKALETLAERKGEVGCVLLDLTMPDMSGEETLGRIKESHPDIPVILSSGYNGQEDGKGSASAKAAGFLQKPYMMDELKEALKAAMK